MKKHLSLFLLVLVSFGVEAQLFKIGKFDVGFVYVGPKVGANITKLNKWSYDNYETKSKFSYQIGVAGELGFTNKFSIQGELLFLSRGTKTLYLPSNFEEDYKTNSISIPLLAKFAFKAFGLSKIYATGGTYSTIKTSGTYLSPTGQSHDDYHWQTFDFGFTFGCGAEYNARQGIWGLDVRYDLGLVDVYRQMDESTKSQFRNLNVTLGYKYDVVGLFKRLRAKKHDPDKQSN